MLYAKIVQQQYIVNIFQNIQMVFVNWMKNRCEKLKQKLCNCGVNYIKVIT
jgi:hypothetical protein